MDSNIFARLQALSSMTEESTIDQSRTVLRRIVDFFKAQEDYDANIHAFAEYVRFLKPETLYQCESFMVQPNVTYQQLPEEFRHDSYGFCRNDYLVFSGRYVYPVKDVKGNIMGFCGYDKFEDTKYLDSTNYGYRAKTYSCWGMECLPTYYRNSEPVFFVEGIVCALYLRQCNLQSLALLGSSVSAYMTQIIRRFGSRAIIVCDSDESGTKCRRYLRNSCPLARCVQSTIAKDIDDSRQVDDNFAAELAKLRNPYYRSKLFT